MIRPGQEASLLAGGQIRRVHGFEQAVRVDEKRFVARVHVENEHQVAVLEEPPDGRKVAVTLTKQWRPVKVDHVASFRIVRAAQVFAELLVGEVAEHRHLAARARAGHAGQLVERQAAQADACEPTGARSMKNRVFRAWQAKGALDVRETARTAARRIRLSVDTMIEKASDGEIPGDLQEGVILVARRSLDGDAAESRRRPAGAKRDGGDRRWQTNQCRRDSDAFAGQPARSRRVCSCGGVHDGPPASVRCPSWRSNPSSSRWAHSSTISPPATRKM